MALCFSINSHYGMFVFEHQFSLWDVCVLALILIMACFLFEHQFSLWDVCFLVLIIIVNMVLIVHRNR